MTEWMNEIKKTNISLKKKEKERNVSNEKKMN